MQQVELRPGLIVRPSILTDAYSLGPRLRDADLAELDAASGSDPIETLAHGYLHKKVCLTLELKGEPIAMFGTVDCIASPGVGIVWLLGSDEITKVRVPFLRSSRHFLRVLAEPYDYLTNVIDERNELHRRWLHWLGCQEIRRHETYGRGGEPFIEFIYQPT